MAEWEDYEVGPEFRRRIMLHGVWDKYDKKSLVVLAKSWLRAPKVELKTDAYSGGNYVSHERAYYFTCKNPKLIVPLEFTIEASEEHPIMNLALVIRNLNTNITLKINSQEITRGKDFRYGVNHDLDGSKIAVWIKLHGSNSTQILITPKGESKK